MPISGGGMCSGVAAVVKALQPGALVIAAEPSGAGGASCCRSCAARLQRNLL